MYRWKQSVNPCGTDDAMRSSKSRSQVRSALWSTAVVAVALNFALVAGSASAGGGPDAYGYTWLDSSDPGGPTFSWVDITTVGTEVSGLTDDNAVGPIAMGMNFQYYWAEYSQITIGSNGWLSFNSVSNISHCFPTIPSPGGSGDNFLAPFMADLIMNGSGNPASVYYYSDIANDRFIVSFHEVPFWVNDAQGWTGSNTFQVILSTVDNSITFQYMNMDATFNDGAGCPSDVSAGIENLTGNIGLQVFVETMPADGSAIAFAYPDPVTFQVIDPAPLWHNDSSNKAVFRPANEDISLANAIWNAGNTDTTAAVSVQGQILDLALAVYSDETVAVPSLVAQEVAPVNFQPVSPPAAGEYFFRTETISAEDINPSNNLIISEIQVVDTTQPTLDLGYTAAATPTGALAWNGGGGGGAVYIRPPIADYRIDSVSIFVGDDTVNPTSDYQVQVLDDNEPNNGPGWLLASKTVVSGTFTPGTWVETTLDVPVSMHGGGFYAAWIANGTNIFVGLDSTGPISRQTWEKIGSNSWAEYRQGSTDDLMIRTIVTPIAPAETPLFADSFESGTTGAWSPLEPR